MPTGLFTPILNDRTRAPYFFNGRLLTGEAMTDEQRAQHAAHELLSRGVGDGVAYGLQVAPSKDFDSVDRPVVTVKAGAAVSRRGDLLLLTADTEVGLVRPATASVAPQRIFDICNPPQQGVYVADAGVYLLTIAPVTVGNGLAPVSGLGGGNACNVKDRVDAVQFRLVQLQVDADILADADRMQNRIAYACFGVELSAGFARDPFGAADGPRTVLDDIDGKTIGDCDVPLAVMYWTATGGIRFVDMWSVRRRLTHSRTATRFPPFSDKRLATHEAMVLQFQAQIETLRRAPGQAAGIVATNHFRYLPPVGLVPIATQSSTGFSQLEFFANLKVRGPVYVEGSRLQTVIQEAVPFFPVDVTSAELIWLYLVRENRQAIDNAGFAISPSPGLVFVTAHVPYRGDAHYDVAKWNYSNYL